MKLTPEERNAVVAYRKEKAHTTLAEAKGIAEQGYWTAVANRLYYSAYYIVTALLIQNELPAHTHSGVRHLFSLHFVKTQKISIEMARIFTKLFELRLSGDYDDLYNLDEEQVKPFVELTENFIKEVETII